MIFKCKKEIEKELLEKELKNKIEIELSKNYYGEPISAGESKWVTVCNLNTIKNCNSDFNFGDFSIINNRGSGLVRKRGAINNIALYEYTTTYNGGGTIAASGTIFLDTENYFRESEKELKEYKESLTFDSILKQYNDILKIDLTCSESEKPIIEKIKIKLLEKLEMVL